MKQRLIHIKSLLYFNLKTLVSFQILYRLFGLAIIFPLTRQLFYLSITLYGKAYVTDTDLFDYVFSPSTIMIGIVLFFVIGLYLVYEVIVLTLLFHESEYENIITLQPLLLTGVTKMIDVLKQYHITIIVSIFVFVFSIEVVHIAGIASTVTLPVLIQERIHDLPYFNAIFVVVVMIVITLYFYTLFFELLAIIEKKPAISTLKKSINKLHTNHRQIIFEFIMINLIVNGFLYLLYLIIIGIVGLIISFVYSSSALFGLMLSALYIIYLIVGFIATMLLMPINYAWISSIYYEEKHTDMTTSDIDLAKVFLPYRRKNPLTLNKTFKRLFIGFLIILFSLNIFLVRDSILNYNPRVQLFNNPRIIAHRGSSMEAPENTLSAIERAILDGADAVEIDVRFTKDNIPILMHDSTLGRTTNDSFNRLVAETTYDEMKELDAGGWFDPEFEGEHIPTLIEALTLTRGRIDVYIELKASVDDAPAILIDIIEKTRMDHNVKILSFNGLLLEEIKYDNPDIDTVQLISTFLGNTNVLANNEMIDYYGLRYALIKGNTEVIRTLQNSGKGIFVYTVNDHDRLIEMNNLGVDGIITNRPLYARELVYSDVTNNTLDQVLELFFKRYE